MNAKELISLLQQLPSESKIVIRGYEDGYNDILKLIPVKIKFNSKAQWYYGQYFLDDGNDAIEAIELYGENKNKEI